VRARRRILLAGHTKFEKVATCKLARIDEMRTFITDRPPPKPLQRLLRKFTCDLHLAASLAK